MKNHQKLKLRFRIWLSLFIIGLILSGLTAIPLVWEVKMLNTFIGPNTWMNSIFPPMSEWIGRVYEGILETSKKYPFILYGTDWLAFAHIMLAVAFIGPLKDPVRNKWVIDFGLIACLGILPIATIFGAIRGIPFFWQLIDCAFCFGAMVPLLICKNYIKKMEVFSK